MMVLFLTSSDLVLTARLGCTLDRAVIKVSLDGADPEEIVLDTTQGEELDRHFYYWESAAVELVVNHTDDEGIVGTFKNVKLGTMAQEVSLLASEAFFRLEIDGSTCSIKDAYTTREQLETADHKKLITTLDPAPIIVAEIGGEPMLVDKSASVKIDSTDTPKSSLGSVSSDAPGFTQVMLKDGTEILAEECLDKDLALRVRPIQLWIPLETLLGKNDEALKSESQGKAALPVSLLAGWPGKKLALDADFNDGGVYDKGHLMPAASGAPHNSFLIVPMFQYINQSGAWRRMERTIVRSMCGLTPTKRPPFPVENDEIWLAACLHGWIRAKDTNWAGYLKIAVRYAGTTDWRVPTSFHVSVHRRKDRMAILRFEAIEHTEKAIAEEMTSGQPSETLKAWFAKAEVEMLKADVVIAKKGGMQVEWDPIRWPEAELPPAGIPESTLPRPYRALDFLTMTSMAESAEKALEEAGDDDEAELLSDVCGATVGPGMGFSGVQRKLAVLYNRYRNGGKFLSDLAKGKVTVDVSIQKYYVDVLGDTELTAWGGDTQAQADHHVPKSTGSGTNYFTNLLYISRKQNLGTDTQNKPLLLTNPIRAKARGSDLSTSSVSSSSKRKQETTSCDTVTRAELSRKHGLTWKQVAQAYKDRWIAESVEADPLLLELGGEYWVDTFDEHERPLPWTEGARAIKSEGNKLMFQ